MIDETIHASCAWCGDKCGYDIWTKRTFLTEFYDGEKESWFEIRHFCRESHLNQYLYGM